MKIPLRVFVLPAPEKLHPDPGLESMFWLSSTGLVDTWTTPQEQSGGFFIYLLPLFSQFLMNLFTFHLYLTWLHGGLQETSLTSSSAQC